MIQAESVTHSLRLSQYHREIALFCLVSIVVAVCAPPWPSGLFVAGLSWGLALFGAGLPFAFALRMLAAPSLFLGVSALSLCFGLGWGEHGLFVVWSSTGFHSAVTVILRSFGAMSAMLVLTLLVPINTLFSMLEKIRVPGFLLEFISLVYRMIFLLEQSRATIWKTQELRQGYDGWRNSMRSLAMLSSSLFIRSHLRAAKLNLGLESRGYEHSLAVQRFSDVPMNAIAVCCAIFVPLLVGFVSFWIAAS